MFDWKRSCMPLLLGLLLSTTGCSSSLRNSSSEPKTASSVPEPSILHDKVVVIPSLDARLRSSRFLAAAPDIALSKPDIQKPIRTRGYKGLPGNSPRVSPARKEIYFVMTVHPREQENVQNCGLRDQDRAQLDFVFPFGRCRGIGSGNWRAGSYEADVYINGERVAMGSFEVY